ncbi:exo-alpha-sialidase [Candidatus Woesearchaeota archaeon]|nr:exo-alpha-sialidase [Candidatus Woesearchaeota archaeon]
MRDKIRIRKRETVFVFLVMLLLTTSVYAVNNIVLSDQGSDVKTKATGSLLETGNLTVEIWTDMQGGSLLYAENFTDAIQNGSWAVMLGEGTTLYLNYSSTYYKDYKINNEDVNYTNNSGDAVGRLAIQSPLGNVSTQEIVKDSGTNWLNQILTAILDNIYDMITNVNDTSNIQSLGFYNTTQVNDTIVALERDKNVSGYYLYNDTRTIFLNGTRLNDTIDDRVSFGDTQKNVTGDYLYNDTATIFFNETLLNITYQKDVRSDCSVGDYVTGVYDNGTLKCDTPAGGSSMWTNSSGNATYTAGNVSIGTTAPTQKLHVEGNVNVTGTLYASNISSNSPLRLQTNDTTRVFVNDSTGNVGIGTETAAGKLSVDGDILMIASTTPSDPTAGTFYFDSSDNSFRFYDGNIWIAMTGDTVNVIRATSVLNSSPTNSSVVITWTTDSAANESLTYGNTTSLNEAAGTNTSTSFVTSHTMTLNNLTNGTAYYYNITVCNSYKYCNTTGPYNFSTKPFNDVTISGVSSLNIANVSATVNWTTDLSSNSSIIYGTTTAMSDGSNSSGSLVTEHSLNITGLIDNTLYYYNVTSCSNDRCTTSGPNSFTTIDYFVITSVSAATTNESGVITWTTSSNTNSTVIYGTDNNMTNASNSSASLTTSHSITLGGLDNSTLYYYNVTSCGSDGLCATSGPNNFTTDANSVVISGLSVAVANTTATITWNTQVDANASSDYGITIALSDGTETETFVNGTQWTTTNVESAGDIGKYPSIVIVDSTIYISYYDESNGYLKFANSSDWGATWATKTIDNSGNVKGHISIDALNKSHIYISYERNTGELGFANSTDNGTTWSTQTVTSYGGKYGSIAVWNSSHIYISYYNSSGDVALAKTNDSGVTWFNRSISALVNTGNYTSIAVPSADTIYVTYDNSVGSPRFDYSTNDGESWSTRELSELIVKVSSMSAIDDNNIYAIGYSSSAILFSNSSDAGGTWGSSTTIENTGNYYTGYSYPAGIRASIFALNTSHIYVSYYNITSTALKFAETTDRGISWTTRTIDNSGAEGEYSSMFALNETNSYITYYEGSTAKNLKFANSSIRIDSVINTSHTIDLTGLTPDTTYYYNVTSCASADNCITSGPYNFTTGGINITNVTANSITNQSAIINWTTTASSNSTVKFGKTTALSDTEWCYQETSNVSTSCGGLSSGTYICDGSWHATFKCENAYDENWGNWAYANSGSVNLSINYTKPDYYSNDSLWYVKTDTDVQGNITLANYSIPGECWEAHPSILQLRLYNTMTPNLVKGYCFNNTDEWSVIFSRNGNPAIVLYEEAMWWNLTRFNSSSSNVNSHSLSLNNLTNNKLYYYNVTSCDSTLCKTLGLYNFTTLS